MFGASEPAHNLSIHDLTRRSTGQASGGNVVDLTFNSRPHKEVDEYRLGRREADNGLSIHDLTRRSTKSGGSVSAPSRLSIHDLTRRSTTSSEPHLKTRDFQFTTSQGGRPLMILPSHTFPRSFNSRPHKEVDYLLDSDFCCVILSIHDLTRRSTRK